MHNNIKDVTNKFAWFFGVVEDVNDPLEIGRVRVRVYNVHPTSVQQMPTESLPWASVIVPVTGGSLVGVGQSPVGVQVGTTVLGFFADASEMQIPVVLGCLPGLSEGQESKNDVSLLARGRDLTNKSAVGPEPAPSYNTRYPYNRVLRSAAGHVIEVDDTPGNERLHIYHKSGTYIEIQPDGTKIDKTNGKSYRISNDNDIIYVNGSLTIQSTGVTNIIAESDLSITSGGAINITSGGVFNVVATRINLEDGSKDTDKF